jgi:phosphate transport system substrate-binding protein
MMMIIKKMNSLTLLLAVAVLLSGTGMLRAEQAVQKQNTEKLKGTITISGAWALYPLVVKWAGEFKKNHPDVRIDVSAGGAGKGMADALSKVVDFGMVSREIHEAEVKKGAWRITVARDAVVPMVNAKNPQLKVILENGIKKNTFAGIWITEKITRWGQAVGNDSKYPIHVYTRSDACGAAETWAKFMGKHQEDLGGVGVYGDPGLALAVRNDRLGIGFNNVTFAYDPKTKKPVDGLRVVPIDVNNNGKIGANENFYDTRDMLTKAIADGKYPSPPARQLYLVCAGKPESKVVKAFLRWVLTDGQKFVTSAGYIAVSDLKLKAGLKRLDEEKKKD